MKKIRLGITALLVLLLVSGCGLGNGLRDLGDPLPAVSTPAGTEVVLSVLVDGTRREAANYILEDLAEQYMDSHGNVTLEIEYLPADEAERELALQNIRAEILAGEGPDVYMMHTNPWLYPQPLFEDVEQAMYNGNFHELSAYYNADTALNAAEFNSSVMEVGTVGEARYILPLAYDIPVLAVNEEVLSDYGLEAEDISGGLNPLLDQCLANEQLLRDSYVEIGRRQLVGITGLSAIGKPVDYATGEILVQEEMLTDFLTKYQQYDIRHYQQCFYEEKRPTCPAATHTVMSYYLSDPENKNWTDTTCFGDPEIPLRLTMLSAEYWNEKQLPFHIESLSSAYLSALIAQAEGYTNQLYPLRGADGKLTASVTCWTAIGSGCDYPDVAYDFLRTLLLPETQWETAYSRVLNERKHTFSFGGFPVRIQGAVEALTESASTLGVSASPGKGEVKKRSMEIGKIVLDQASFPLLEASIEAVRFPTDLDCVLISAYRASISAPVGPDAVYEAAGEISQVSDDFLRAVTYRVGEG